MPGARVLDIVAPVLPRASPIAEHTVAVRKAVGQKQALVPMSFANDQEETATTRLKSLASGHKSRFRGQGVETSDTSR
jgi:hypothetical protein